METGTSYIVCMYISNGRMCDITGSSNGLSTSVSLSPSHWACFVNFSVMFTNIINVLFLFFFFAATQRENKRATVLCLCLYYIYICVCVSFLSVYVILSTLFASYFSIIYSIQVKACIICSNCIEVIYHN